MTSFEVEDEKLGKLKIFNVTEARANFASVLKENQAKVIITRHGRPSKILINYEEYLSLMKKEGMEKPKLENPLPASIPPTLNASSPGRWTEEDLNQIVQSITQSGFPTR
ncbi:MAG: type II toxin-antitoxin system Phd/YefM family antitoxin [bacterium]